MSLYRLLIYINQLPNTSRLVRIQLREIPEDQVISRGGNGSIFDWDQKEWMLADLIDLMAHNIYLMQVKMVDPKKAKGIKPPKPYRRPGQPPPKPKKALASPAQLKAAFTANVLDTEDGFNLMRKSAIRQEMIKRGE